MYKVFSHSNTNEDYVYKKVEKIFNTLEEADRECILSSDYLYDEALRYETERMNYHVLVRMDSFSRRAVELELDYIYKMAWDCRGQKVEILETSKQIAE